MEPSRMSPKAAVSAIVLSLALGITLGALGRARRVAPEDAAAPALSPAGGIKPPRLPASPPDAPPPARPQAREITSPKAGPETLVDRLQRLRNLLVEKLRRPKGADLSDLTHAMTEGWDELHRAVLKDPAGFFAFLKAPGNEEMCEGLLAALSRSPMIGTHFLGMMEKLPPGIFDGLADLLSHGSKAQQLAAAQVARDLIGTTPEGKGRSLLEPCLALLLSEDPRAQGIALDLLRSHRPERLEESLEFASSLWDRSNDPEVRTSVLCALAQMKSTAADQVFFDRLTEAMRDHLGHASDPLAAPTLQLFREKILTSKPDVAARYGAVLLSALQGARDPDAFRTCARAALDLPVPQATSLLEQSLASAPTPETRTAIRTVLDQIKAGEVRPARLQAALGTGGAIR